MEKLKQAKHNHLLTDWLKVGIFALLLLLPFFVFAPTAFYYGFNEHATAPTKQVENTTTIHMQQNVINGIPTSTNGFELDNFDETFVDEDGFYLTTLDGETSELFVDTNSNEYLTNDKVLISFDFWYNSGVDLHFDFALTGDYGNLIFYSNVELIDGKYQKIATFENNDTNIKLDYVFYSTNDDVSYYLKYFQLFNLTQMFGSGNEPTIDEFNALFPNDYYTNDSDANIELPNGTYTTYTDISSTMSFAWESMFDTPLLKWTKDSPFKTSINGFLTIFQIPQQSGIGLYLNYLITMVCIYVVFDIVIQLFKWITHIIGEK